MDPVIEDINDVEKADMKEEEKEKVCSKAEAMELEKRIKALEDAVSEIMKTLETFKVNKYPMPSKYPYPATKSEGNTFESWMETISKSIDAITDHLGLDKDPEIKTLQKSIDERDIKIKELSDRLELLEQKKVQKAKAVFSEPIGQTESNIIIKDGQVFRE